MPAVETKPNQNSVQNRKPTVKIKRSRKQITLVAKFNEPTDSQLSAISQALFALLDK